MVTRMGVPGSVGSAHLPPAMTAHRTCVQGEDRAPGLPQPCSFGACRQLDPGEARPAEPAPGRPLVPLVWAGGEQKKVWGRKAPMPGWQGAQQGESWVPCPRRVPELCSAVTSGLPRAWGSAHKEAKPPRRPPRHRGLVSRSRWGWTDQADSAERVREGLLRAPRVEGLEMEREGEGLQARKGRMKPM